MRIELDSQPTSASTLDPDHIRPRIVTIGGGTGTFTVLTGLKRHPGHITAVVTMADSGGSSGRLRDELGVLPPGDLRQALVALSYSSKLMRDLFNYRFEQGDLMGHNFGNLFVSAMEKVTGDIGTASERIGEILKVRGKVLPVTLDTTQLVVKLENGQIIESEHLIDEPDHDGKLRIIDTYLNPSATLNPHVASAVAEADLVVIGPGDVFTSIVPNLVVDGMKEALASSPAKKVYICNLMTKFGQTNGMDAKQHVDCIEQYIGKGVINAVIINNMLPQVELIQKYAVEGDLVRAEPDDFSDDSYKVIFADVIAEGEVVKNKVDTLQRSLIRHDPHKLAAVLTKLVNE